MYKRQVYRQDHPIEGLPSNYTEIVYYEWPLVMANYYLDLSDKPSYLLNMETGEGWTLDDRYSVSYTHLDVYKRQHQFLAVCALRRWCFILSHPHTPAVRNSDVYKRQGELLPDQTAQLPHEGSQGQEAQGGVGAGGGHDGYRPQTRGVYALSLIHIW